ncbi:hypothetical protein P691DRAFT_775161 [Macrolepiota fuliginosa MF-IS2]|uniref:RING-type domain-containing protein n=1 Tax=Macrolepiota fuliginosa MF-IS2 TaxID=1400762 RepID=A0A9P6C4W2_9AGAR|nr:hypothetical protein P691DRAFT_775161 [Macrolepiota fuliginosa MF-IS2]
MLWILIDWCRCSVAAAATAASLLTGSSEPILSSGLAPPASGSTGSAASASASASPSSPFASAPAASASTSPTLNVPSSNTSNLLPSAFFSPPPPPPPLPSFISSNLNSNSNSNSGSARHIGVGDMSPAGRAERMRQAWGTIRERLGLRANSPSSPSSSPSSSSSSSPLSSSSTSSSALYSPSSSSPTSGFGSGSGSGSNATPTSASSPASLLSALAPASPFGGGGSGRDRERNQTLTDTREQMLAEMARAFNIGLGLGAGEEQAQSREQSREQGQRQEQQEAGGQRDRERRGESGGMGAGAGSGEGERDREREREREREAEMPPEGSFERFLVELQADLRVALTQDRGEEHERGEREGGAEREREPEREPEREERRETPVPETRERVPSVRSLVPTEPASDNEDADMPPLQDVSFSDSDYEGPEESVEDDFSSVNTSPTGEAPRAQATNESSARPTDGGTPRAGLDASGRINWWRLYRFPPVMSARTGGPGPTGPGTMPTMLASASPFGPSVPMGGPAFGGPGLSDTYSPMFGNGPSSSSSGGGGGGAPAREGASGASARAGNGNGNGGGNAASVVPVIIVGLQSVNAPGWMGMDDGADLFDDVPHDRHHHHHHHNHHHQRGATMPDLGEEDEDEDAFFGGFGPSMAARQERRRAGGSGGGGWQNRAASALRNLRSASGTGAGAGAGTGGGAGIGIGVGNRRSQGLGMDGLGGLGGIGGHGQGMGRRQQQQQQQQQPLPPMIGGPGSRTFLIYVIGGYYPPDHSIVTGGPDNLESFEALLELVELLGNAKAATATKEDIEKSGLEVIKKSQLTEYERDNKVSSNCVERCLICLDDYEEQDEIRVMGCRHAFHRGCVDKWLQTGKNNCPACRSRGVSTEGPSPTQTAT